MISLILCYIVFGSILIIYGTQVCPFLEGLGYLQATKNTFIPILLILPLRIYLFKRNTRNMRHSDSKGGANLYTLPWKEFAADFLTWFIIGLIMGMIYLIYFQFPFLTGMELFIGCISFGLFGGMLCFLSMERKLIEFLKRVKTDVVLEPKKPFSVTKKMLFFMISVIVFMVMAILLMVFMDINYLLAHKDSFDDSIYFGVFKEILFAFLVLLFMSLFILGRYSQNLKTILSLQLDVMEDISQGNYNTMVPVVTNDEFGLIAAKTNQMIDGLRDREFCQISFGRYVTPEVSEKILQGEIALEGELRDVTILFCDLRGYTTFAEGKEPRKVVQFLNEYFTEMEKTIKQHKGIVLQYIGDEIEAVFGAPEDLPNHPEMAVRAALEMRKSLRALNEKRESTGENPIAHGIGVHTGEVLAGSVGSPDRLVYAMVGDTVNSASRIQVLNKTFGTDILISQRTKDLIKAENFNLSSLGQVALKGKSEEIEVYKVI
ncbi:MAG: adenylate/guanylate cyclase domain-containing protein [Deltaproteobacteria bacterium]|nr:adenylate/guanylate cyclase domain-containing protein [Deltaproteobacteria bacterium]